MNYLAKLFATPKKPSSFSSTKVGNSNGGTTAIFIQSGNYYLIVNFRSSANILPFSARLYTIIFFWNASCVCVSSSRKSTKHSVLFYKQRDHFLEILDYFPCRKNMSELRWCSSSTLNLIKMDAQQIKMVNNECSSHKILTRVASNTLEFERIRRIMMTRKISSGIPEFLNRATGFTSTNGTKPLIFHLVKPGILLASKWNFIELFFFSWKISCIYTLRSSQLGAFSRSGTTVDLYKRARHRMAETIAIETCLRYTR